MQSVSVCMREGKKDVDVDADVDVDVAVDVVDVEVEDGYCKKDGELVQERV